MLVSMCVCRAKKKRGKKNTNFDDQMMKNYVFCKPTTLSRVPMKMQARRRMMMIVTNLASIQGILRRK
nr:hypothetical protein [Tanacetum cinerariifolium]